MLLEKAQKTITEHNLIQPGDKIIVGVSGGSDSVCLLDILSKLQAELDLELTIAHVNYGFRGEESDRDEAHVKKLAKKYGLPCKILRPEPATKKSGNLESNFRDIRYNFFRQLTQVERANKIAVAHNRDDQTETILMFFLRGSGLTGLSGMAYKKEKIIRPLLNCSRVEILTYLKKKKLSYQEDKTNQDPKYTRNKIRHKLIPLLEKEYNPNLRQTLAQSGRITRGELEIVQEVVTRVYQELADYRESETLLPLDKFLALSKAVRRGLLRHICAELLSSTTDISALDIEETLRMLEQAKGGSHRDIKGLRISKKGGKIILTVLTD